MTKIVSDKKHCNNFRQSLRFRGLEEGWLNPGWLPSNSTAPVQMSHKMGITCTNRMVSSETGCYELQWLT